MGFFVCLSPRPPSLVLYKVSKRLQSVVYHRPTHFEHEQETKAVNASLKYLGSHKSGISNRHSPSCKPSALSHTENCQLLPHLHSPTPSENLFSYLLLVNKRIHFSQGTQQGIRHLLLSPFTHHKYYIKIIFFPIIGPIISSVLFFSYLFSSFFFH